MDTLSIFKFWKSNNKSKIAVTTTIDGDSDTIVSDPITDFSDGDDDDESFFELELTLPKFNPKPSPQFVPKITEPNNNSKVSSKPQSPISILRSASPNLKIFMFGKKSKTEPATFPETDNFTVKFNIEDGSIVPKFTRANSENQLLLKNKNESKRFLSFKFGKTRKSRGGGEERRVSSSSVTETYTFPSPMIEREKRSRFKVKELGKSKSASAIVVSLANSNNNRSDYVACDGIESAILHCKRSLDSNSPGEGR